MIHRLTFGLRLYLICETVDDFQEYRVSAMSQRVA